MSLLTVKSHSKIASETFELVLSGATTHKPGQFVEVEVSSQIVPFLRRPISICNQENDEITLIYKTFGNGTKELSETARVKSQIDVLETLGNGFQIPTSNKVYLVGGGIGVPPLYYMAKTLLNEGKEVVVVLGFNTKEDAFYLEQFSLLTETRITTMDGSLGVKGTVFEVLNDVEDSAVISVGPTPMLKAIKKSFPKAQLSLEERMGCGFGACMGCSIQTKQGPKRVCKEGPVFIAEDLLWDV